MSFLKRLLRKGDKVDAPSKQRRVRRIPLERDVTITAFEQPEGAYTKDSAWSAPTIKGQGYGADPQMAGFFAERGFIGYQLCAQIATHWLVDKACNMPAKDALRPGWKIQEQDEAVLKRLHRLDRKMDIALRMRDVVRFGRVYGGQLALFDIATDNPAEFYENPFNRDGVTKGSYRGIILIDPVDATPVITADTVQDPAHPMYMKPTYWMIGGRKYHHTHFIQFVPYPVAKLARHRYNYFGVSVPERIYERVYAAEKTANEAPALTMTKRLVAMAVAGLDDADQDVVDSNIRWLTQMRDNYGVLATDGETSVTQLETSLADLDATIMTQYQLVAAAANVPATKLIETTPKGFNATGEYEAASYRETLESIQENDLRPLLERHYQIGCKSLGIDQAPEFKWQPLDSPTAKEQAEVELLKAQADQMYSNAGAIDGYDMRKRLAADEDGPYFGVDPEHEPEPEPEPESPIGGFGASFP